MHKRLVNECLIDFTVKTEGPLLVKSGVPGGSGVSDMTPVVTFRRGTRPEPYLPGSSLKGALRSHAERIARTLCYDPANGIAASCDPFNQNWELSEGSCSHKLQFRKDRFKRLTERNLNPDPDNEIPSTVAYRDSCPICKIYGNTFLLGRFSIGDGYLLDAPQPNQKPYRTEVRDMVGIDRFTGGSSSGAKFDMEVVINATFGVRIKLTNFELWQVGLIAFVLRDLSQGLIPLGMGKSRGLGQVSATVNWVQIAQVRRRTAALAPDHVYGLYPLEAAENRQQYGYWNGEGTGVVITGHSSPLDSLGLRTVYRLEEPAVIDRFWAQVAPLTAIMLENYPIPERMRPDYLRNLQEAAHAG